MKSIKHLGWLVLALALFLTGCGTDSASTDAEGKEEQGPTPEEILQKSAEANEDLNSYDMDMTMDMDVKATGLDESMTSTAIHYLQSSAWKQWVSKSICISRTI